MTDYSEEPDKIDTDFSQEMAAIVKKVAEIVKATSVSVTRYDATVAKIYMPGDVVIYVYGGAVFHKVCFRRCAGGGSEIPTRHMGAYEHTLHKDDALDGISRLIASFRK